MLYQHSSEGYAAAPVCGTCQVSLHVCVEVPADPPIHLLVVMSGVAIRTTAETMVSRLAPVGKGTIGQVVTMDW